MVEIPENPRLMTVLGKLFYVEKKTWLKNGESLTLPNLFFLATGNPP